MTTIASTSRPARLQPAEFAAEWAVRPPSRPRLLSHVGRWGRARRWLPAGARVVLDVGAAYGYGTAALSGAGRQVVGVERDQAHIREAARQFPWVPMLKGDAVALPVAGGSVDAVVMLDVLEHVAEPDAVLAEIQRVLRPGGVLILSVPNRGLLAGLDPNNAYAALQRCIPSWPALEPAEESASGTHRHFTLAEARALLAPRFAIERSARTGLGVSEVLHLAILVLFKGALGWRRVYRALLGLHLLAYLLDDLVPAGPAGYHLTLSATARPRESRR